MLTILASQKWDLFYQQFVTYEGYKTVVEGLQITLLIAILGLLIGIVIGTLIAIIKVVPKYKLGLKILEKFADFYVGLFRGTPMVVQLLIGYFVIFPLLNIRMNNLNVIVAVIIFGMNSGAYVSEIMRSGIQSVDIGQLEAGRALGLPYGTAMMRIVIPQAIKNILPTLGNEFISLVKETSVVSFIAIVDLTKAFKQLGDANYEYLVPYLMLALTYLVIVYIISILVKIIERRMKKSDRRN